MLICSACVEARVGGGMDMDMVDWLVDWLLSGCIYVYMYICIYVYMYICIYVYMCVCVYVYM